MTAATGNAQGSRPIPWIWEFAEAIKFQHSVFALPFAVLGMLLGWRQAGQLSWTVVGLALGCCVAARTAAMAYNRYLDADIDARNPRTATRAVPAGRLSRQSMLQVTILSSALFWVLAALINTLAGLLAPVALAIVLGYSHTKRFTALCHFVLGLALAIAPSGGYIAMAGTLSLAPVLLSAGVLLWTAGFDVIYSCQDEDYDRQSGLHSIPAWLGYSRALNLALILHFLCIPSFVAAGIMGGLGSGYQLGCVLAAGILAAQHIIVRRLGPRGIPMAFFTVNGWTGVALLTSTAIGLWWFPIP